MIPDKMWAEMLLVVVMDGCNAATSHSRVGVHVFSPCWTAFPQSPAVLMQNTKKCTFHEVCRPEQHDEVFVRLLQQQ